MAPELTRDEMDMLAAEYVLGVQDADERAETRSLIDGNGTMRALVEGWEQRFQPMNADYPVIAAPDVWSGLDSELFKPARRRNRIFWLAVGGLVVAFVVKVTFWGNLFL